MTIKRDNQALFVELNNYNTRRIEIFLSSYHCRKYCRSLMKQVYLGKADIYKWFISDDYFLFQNKKRTIDLIQVLKKIEKALRFSESEDSKNFIKGIKLLKDLHLSDRFYQKVEQYLLRWKGKKRLKILPNLALLNLKIRDLRTNFCTQNINLVKTIVNKYTSYRAHYEDLLQEGILGLLYAFERYDHTADCQYHTYAGWYIKQRILLGIQHINNIRIPNYILSQNNKAVERVKEMVSQGEQIEAILDHVKESEIKYLPIQKVNMVSIDCPLSHVDESFTIENMLENQANVPAIDFMGNQAIYKKVNKLLKKLTPREEKLLRLRFGIVDIDLYDENVV